jgi:hypothetical protein
MRSSAAVLFVFLLFVFEAGAQSPTDGRVQGGAYVNSYFHVSYTWAKNLQPLDLASLHLPQKSISGNEFLLFSARQGDQPYGVVMLAEKLNVPTPHSSKGLKDAAEMMEMIMRFRPEQHVAILSKKHFTSANGFVFDELDYTENGEYSGALITPVGDSLLVFKCNAQSAADLATMTASVTAMQKAN